MINGMERLAYDGGRLTEMILSRLTMRQKKQSTDKDGSDINTERLEPWDITIIEIYCKLIILMNTENVKLEIQP